MNEIAIANDRDSPPHNVYVYQHFEGNYIVQKQFGDKYRETAAIGDCDNDGLNELVLWYNPVSGSDFLMIYQWNGLDYIQEYNISTPGSGTNDVTIGDCDNDGFNELVVSRMGPAKGLYVYKYESGNYNLKNTVLNEFVYGIFVDDVDYDEQNELIAGGASTDDNLKIYSYISNNYYKDWNLSGHPGGLAVGDFDSDSKSELILSSKDPSKLIEFTGSTYSYVGFTNYYSPYSRSSGDINNDGDFEFMLCGHYIWDFAYPNTKVYDYRSGSMKEIWSKNITQQPYYIYGAAICDVNNDGFGELLFANDVQKGNLTIYKPNLKFHQDYPIYLLEFIALLNLIIRPNPISDIINWIIDYKEVIIAAISITAALIAAIRKITKKD